MSRQINKFNHVREKLTVYTNVLHFEKKFLNAKLTELYFYTKKLHGTKYFIPGDNLRSLYILLKKVEPAQCQWMSKL